MNSKANGTVTLLMNGAWVTVTRTAHGATVTVTEEGSEGYTAVADTEAVEGLYEALEQAKADYTELAAKYQRMDEGYQAISQRDWKLFAANGQKLEAERKKAHEDRMSMARRFIDANQRAYAAERRVRELEAKVECLEQDLLRAAAQSR